MMSEYVSFRRIFAPSVDALFLLCNAHRSVEEYFWACHDSRIVNVIQCLTGLLFLKMARFRRPAIPPPSVRRTRQRRMCAH